MKLKNNLKKIKNKKGFELEVLGWWILGIAVLVIVIFGMIILKGKGVGMIDYIKQLFRFGR